MGRERTKQTKRTGGKPITPISPMKKLCRTGVQNEGKGCPEWGWTIENEKRYVQRVSKPSE